MGLCSLNLGLPLSQGKLLGGPPLDLASFAGLLGVGGILADGGVSLLVNFLNLKIYIIKWDLKTFQDFSLKTI